MSPHKLKGENIMTENSQTRLLDIAARIKEMREIMGWSTKEMADKTEVSEAEYITYEAAEAGRIISWK